MFLNDAKADAESKPSTFANRLGGIEWIENAVRLFNSRPGIGKQNRHACAVAHGLDRQRAPAVVRLHGVHGVVHNIEEHLHQLISIASYTGKHGFQFEINFCAGVSQIKGTELNGVGDNSVEIEQRTLRGNLPGKAQ